MQSKENKIIDTRTFGELWNSLNKYEKTALFAALLRERACSSRQTLWLWCKKTRPHPLKAELAVKAINKSLGITTTIRTLFPEN